MVKCFSLTTLMTKFYATLYIGLNPTLTKWVARHQSDPGTPNQRPYMAEVLKQTEDGSGLDCMYLKTTVIFMR